MDKTLVCLTDWMKDWTREECRAKLLEEEVAAGGVTCLDEVAEEPQAQKHYRLRLGETLRLRPTHPGGPGWELLETHHRPAPVREILVAAP